MYYHEEEARKQIIEAGLRLQEKGLIARTWGNISARISDTQYIITPSGMAYDTLKPEELVKVNIRDGRYEGDIKPSGEKAVHAAVYMLKPETRFVIHTHQVYASVVGVGGKDIRPKQESVLGEVVPCAAYGKPSSGKLCRNVMKTINANPNARAILLMRHGVLYLGADPEEIFDMAEQLEQECRSIYEKTVVLPGNGRISKGAQTRAEETIRKRMRQAVSGVAETSQEVLLLSEEKKTIRPYLDDLAQIAGPSIRCTENIEAGLRDREAVLVPGLGAYCIGTDADAVAMLLSKNAKAHLYARAVGGLRPLSFLDANSMRHEYVQHYAKRKV